MPVIQAPACNRSRDDWADDEAGLTPLDVAMGVAIPEFDGRIIGPAFAFKEEVDDGGELGTPVIASRTDPERAARVAGLAVRHARLRRLAPADARIAVVMSAYPTKRSRLGNAVGLDTPASVVELLHAMRDAGYRVDRIPDDGDALMAELADRLTYESPALTPTQAAKAAGRLPAADYEAWFSAQDPQLRGRRRVHLGPAAGRGLRRPGHPRGGAGRDIVFPGIDLGGVLVTVQPPRGFGSDPIGTYHAPDVPPPHHYLAFYRWLDTGWGADAVVHLGKHGTLEWLPGKANALSAACHPDAALGDLPFVYPFVVNDPGEGTQAKRRTHAVIIDHLVPPMTRAEATDDVSRLETLLDAYATAQAMDPGKLPALRRQVWELLVEAEIHRDLGIDEEHAADDAAFDDMVLHVDGYLCALKDAQIRGGLHVLGQPPEGEALVDLVLAITRLQQGTVPSLRATVAGDLGFDPATERRHEVDKIEAECRARVEALAARDWAITPLVPPRCDDGSDDEPDDRSATDDWRRRSRSRRADLVAPATGSAKEMTQVDAGGPDRAVDLRPARPRAAGHARRDREHPRRPRRAATSPPGPAAPPPAAAPTCCRPAATSTRSTPRPCPPACRGRSAPRWPTPSSSGTWPRPAPHRRRSASCCGARPPCGPAATTPPRPSPCSACARCGTTTRAASSGSSRSPWPSWAGPAST